MKKIIFHIFIFLSIFVSTNIFIIYAQERDNEGVHTREDNHQNPESQTGNAVYDIRFRDLAVHTDAQKENMFDKDKTNYIDTQTGMEMIYIPAGEFLFGSNPEEDSYYQENELPQQSVFLDNFWISKTEITNEQYSRCVEEGACESAYYMSLDLPETNDYPVNYVSYKYAQDYCTWIGGQLPNELQWEKAARGTDGRIYPWGNEVPTLEKHLANLPLKDNVKIIDLLPVGSFPLGASPYGLLDMSGNVWEWILDGYNDTYYQQIKDEFGHMVNKAEYQEEQKETENDNVHMIRGGSAAYTEVNNSHIYFRAAHRSFISLPSNYYIGFRCVVIENSMN